MICSFCKGKIEKGTGRMFVKNDGRVFYFCSSKCFKNWRLGREGKKMRWVKKKKK